MRPHRSERSRARQAAVLAVLCLCWSSMALAQINSTGAVAPSATAPATPPLPTTTATGTPASATGAPAAAVQPGTEASTGVPGVIAGSGVNVRQGPGTEYHIYLTAPAGYPVQVVGKKGEWLEIKFPGAGFSYVAKEFIQKIDDKTAMVTGTGVSVRSGPGTKYDRLYTVPAGHKFAIIGTDPTGAWYQVAPLPGATAWITAQYVKLSGQVAESEKALPPVESTTGETVAPAEETAAPKVEEKPDPMADKLAQAEQLFKTETEKQNASEWDLPTLESMYNEVEAGSTSTLNKELARRRLAQLDAYEAVKTHNAQIEKVGQDLQKQLSDLEKKRQADLIAAAGHGMKETPYAAVGTVEKFYIQGLGGATHKLVNDITIDFLLKSDVVDLNTLVGKKVGVKGKFEFISGQSVRLINVTSAEVAADTEAVEEVPAAAPAVAVPAAAIPAEAPAAPAAAPATAPAAQ